ncbi:MAG: hypothetical protein M0Q13_05650 [Methanothrix sp.]|nr:hypothetical protein [Methanothrix sp.]
MLLQFVMIGTLPVRPHVGRVPSGRGSISGRIRGGISELAGRWFSSFALPRYLAAVPAQF